MPCCGWRSDFQTWPSGAADQDTRIWSQDNAWDQNLADDRRALGESATGGQLGRFSALSLHMLQLRVVRGRRCNERTCSKTTFGCGVFVATVWRYFRNCGSVPNSPQRQPSSHRPSGGFRLPNKLARPRSSSSARANTPVGPSRHSSSASWNARPTGSLGGWLAHGISVV